MIILVTQMISTGTLKLTGALSNSTDLIIDSSATLDLQVSQQFSSLDLNGTITRTAGTSSLTISGTSDQEDLQNVTTSGTQTYTGNTTISAGTLAIQGQLESGIQIL